MKRKSPGQPWSAQEIIQRGAEKVTFVFDFDYVYWITCVCMFNPVYFRFY